MKETQNRHGFKVTGTRRVEEIESDAFIMEHEATGASLIHLKNADPNKCFCVTFRTPPSDDCGTPHIMEHSVLCGSEKYPLKEPFIELAKSSLSTFLNAMTWPDKTMYPVASLNEADLMNLTNVYLDAVFHPLIKKDPRIFMQEGWHHHLEEEGAPLTVNGVVYNEMKGAYSNPDDILENTLRRALYAGTCYAFDSGGNPQEIPNLTYSGFTSFYDRNYHPSNAFFYLYGDMDPDPFLEAIDKSLKGFGRRETDTMPQEAPVMTSPVRAASSLPVADDGKAGEGACFAVGWRLRDPRDPLMEFCMSVLDGVLMDNDSSPLRKALLDSGIAAEYSSDLCGWLREPFYMIKAKTASPEDFERFTSVVMSTLEALARDGVEQDLITASLNSFEFDLREADSGGYPRGLLYLQDVLDSWIYGEHPTLRLEYSVLLEDLRRDPSSARFQKLISDQLLENPARADCELIPDPGLASRREGDLAAGLAALKSSMSPQDVGSLIRATAGLIERQASQDSQEARAFVPSLELSQIPAAVPRPDFSASRIGASTLYVHRDASRGVTYLDISFPFCPSCEKDIPRAELLSKILGVYATQRLSEADLAKATGLHLGGVDSELASYALVDEPGRHVPRFGLYLRAMTRNIPVMLDIASQILRETLTPSPRRLLVTVNEEISKFENHLLTSGHSVVAGRLSAYATGRGAFGDLAGGLGWYAYLKETRRELEAGGGGEAASLKSLLESVCGASPDALITSDEADAPEAMRLTAEWLEGFGGGVPQPGHEPAALGELNEALAVSSTVNYVGRGGNFRLLGMDYDPAMAAVRTWMRTAYLWDNVRLIGGAYGAFFSVDKTGTLQFVSYRDPRLEDTLAAYDAAADALESEEFSALDVRRLIIGTISDLDAPRPPYATGRRMLSDVYRGDSWEAQQANRSAVLALTAGDLKAVCGVMRKTLASCGAVCVLGSAPAIERARGLFSRVINPLRDI